MVNNKYTIVGMTCAACQSAVEKSISSLDGIADVSVNLLSNSATVNYDENIISSDKIIAAVKKAGYSALPYENRKTTFEKEEKQYIGMKKRLIVSAFFAVIMLLLTLGNMKVIPLPYFISPESSPVSALFFAFAELLIASAVIIINRFYFIDGFRALLNRSPNMNTLVSSGAGASMIYGIFITVKMIVYYSAGNDIREYPGQLFFESVTMILTLISLGRLLESRSRRHTADAVKKLINLTPQNAEIKRDGISVTIPSSEIKVGDTVIVRSGCSIPCDGSVIKGECTVDESMLTGESIPVSKKENENVISGTVLLSGYIEVIAEKVAEDTTVSKITEMVENASSSKAPQQKLADRISRVFVPVVFLISFITFIFWILIKNNPDNAITFAISVLVISCPCSLGLATPTAVMCGIGRGASMGILFKSANALDTLSKASVVVFDKTGTITEGKLNVAEITAYNGCEDDKLLSVAQSLEYLSEHPIGKAIYFFCKQKNVPLSEVEKLEQTFGGGVKGIVNGKVYFAGNKNYILSQNINIHENIYERINNISLSGKTPVLISDTSKIIGIITVCDKIKEETHETLSSLRSLNMETVMLTGDNLNTANSIGKEIGISEIIAEVKPDEKALNVRSIMSGEYSGDRKRRYVIMTGDGINDAPALAQSDCGIAVANGSDIAIESAEVILVKNNLNDISKAILISRKVIKIIKENLAWAFAYNILCIPIAAGLLSQTFGISLTPVIASASMSLSSICVVLNALRLLKYSPSLNSKNK